ncbi:MAG: hypothetical protein E1N59_1930 [Puniceicoccaceae bacterium 5H]|nr:MAG: hypothetical protein E1N59_1930 [Puniceicoccaceae bacterium 5H]
MPRVRLWHLSLQQGLLSLQAQAAWLLVPLWGAQAGWNLRETGWVLAAQAVGTALGSIGAGILAARWGAGRVVRLSSWLVALFLLALALPVEGALFWAAMRACAGCSLGLSRGLVPMVAVNGEDRPQKSLALSTAGYIAGQAAGLPLAMLIGSTVSATFVLAALGVLLAVSTLFLGLPSGRREGEAASLRRLGSQILHELQTPSTLGTVSLYAASFAIGGALLGYLPLWWTEEQLRDSSTLAVWLSLGGAIQAGLLVLLGQLQVERSVVRRIGGWMFASGLVCLTGPLFWQMSPYAAGFWLLMMLVTRAGRIPAIQESLFCHGDPGRQAIRLSLCYGMAELGRAVGATGASWVYPSSGYAGVTVAAGLLAVVALGALPWLSHTRQLEVFQKSTPTSE